MKPSLEEIIGAGMHLGHSARCWNPKISIYTYGIKDGVYLIDLVKTSQQLVRARKFLTKIRRDGKNILFVGTKAPAVEAIKSRAIHSESFFVRQRWLGGTLTNWSTIKASMEESQLLERKENEKNQTSTMKKRPIVSEQRFGQRLGGLNGLQTLPGAVVIVGQPTEWTAIQECRKLNIPVVCRLDTDCDPTVVEIGVPMNDDSTASICLFFETLIPGIQEGRRWWLSKKIKNRTKLRLLTSKKKYSGFLENNSS
jgi:small subunit ribosomal protein S2